MTSMPANTGTEFTLDNLLSANNRQAEKIAYDLSGKKTARLILVAALVIIDFLLAGWAATIGPADITITQAYAAIIDLVLPGYFDVPAMHHTVVVNIRLPRILMANLAGFGLGMAGCAMQGVLKNPLASPYTLGISAAAGFGASLAIVLGVGIISSQYMIVVNAFVFALACSAAVLMISGRRDAMPETMILAGIAIMFLFSAGVTVMQFIADPYAIQAVVFWLVGDVGRASWGGLMLNALILLPATVYLIKKTWDLDILGFGDETAVSLGVNVGWTRNSIMAVCSILTAAIVAFIGAVGFIGLVAPHIMRLAVKDNHRMLIPASGLAGAVLLSAADMVSLTILAPNVMPVGVITSIMGVPLFLYFIVRGKRKP